MISFAVQKLCSLVKSYLGTVGLNFHVNGVLFRNFIPTPIFCRVLTRFSSGTFSVYSFVVKLKTHLKLLSCKKTVMGPISVFPVCGHVVSPALFVGDVVFSPLCAFDIFVKCQIAGVVCVHIVVFYFAPLVYMSIFVTISYCFY